MIFTDYRFLLDVHEINSQISLSFKQGETGRVLHITLTENGDIFDIPQDCVPVFTALKPDGTIIFNDCEIDGNEIIYTNTAQTAIVSGKVDCELRLYGAGNTLLVSPHFTIFVHPTVYADQIESKDEVNTLTNLISEASTKLENGDFIPKLSVGTVSTLPAGSVATVNISGTPEAPVLNFGIPQGEQGQAESLIPDTALSTTSTKPVQNKVIAQAVNSLAEEINNLGLAIEQVDKDNTESLNALAEEVEDKVAKVDGMGLSSNDFTNDEKDKLSRVAWGANNYTLPVGGEVLGGVKDGGDVSIADDGSMSINDGAVTAAKIAVGAVSQVLTATVPADGWTLQDSGFYRVTVTLSGMLASDRPFYDINMDGMTAEEAQAAEDAFDQIARLVAQAGSFYVDAYEAPGVAIPIKMEVVRK